VNHFLRRFPQFTLLLWLVGCGPGVGGSGTGEPAQAAADFGAVAAPVCGAAFAPRLNCAPSPGGVSPPADAGTAPLSFVDMATGGQVSATLQANGVVLEARCQRLRFNGVWAVTGAGDARFYGTLTDDASGLSELASLDGALLGTGIPFKNHCDDRLEPYSKSIEILAAQCAGIRRAGAAALDLAYVAAGRLDAFWEIGLAQWDMAAGVLLVREAGGLVADVDASENYLESGNIVAGNPRCFKAVLQVVKPLLG